jgi:hypothetical protein
MSSALSRGDKKKNSKSVRFPEDEETLSRVVLVVEACEDFTDEDKKTLWFARSDYHFSRSTARVIAKESERYGHSKHLDDVYKTAFNEQVQGRLNIWALHGSSRRGLERWANSSHGQARKDDQYMYIQGLLRSQQEMKFKDCFNDERLREVGHILSRKSRLFAQMMGEADAHAARWEFGMTDARAHCSPRQRLRKKNLGLVGKVNRVSDLPHPPVPHHHRQMRRVSDAPMRRVSDAPMRRVSDAPMRRVSDAPMRRVSDIPMRRVSDAAPTAPKFTIKTRPVGRVSRVA